MARLRHRRNIQSAAAGLLGESIWPGTACANLAAFRWRLSMDHYTKPPSGMAVGSAAGQRSHSAEPPSCRASVSSNPRLGECELRLRLRSTPAIGYFLRHLRPP
jgi:hypothetical protein